MAQLKRTGFISILLLLGVSSYTVQALMPVSSSHLSGENDSLASGVVASVPDSNEKGPSDQNEDDQGSFDFGSQGMLQWAIKHADPKKLQESAAQARRNTQDELEAKREEMKLVMEKLRMPSDAELMKLAIADLVNSSLSVKEHLDALKELQVLAEPIDNANDLHKLGGLLPVLETLGRQDVELRTMAAWVLGIAAQNNKDVQQQILELGGLPRLMGMLGSTSADEVVKALYAISAVVRNNKHGAYSFASRGGASALLNLLEKEGVDVRLQRKAVALVSDLAQDAGSTGVPGASLTNPDGPRGSSLNDERVLKALVGLLATGDIDMVEKVLVALEALALHENTRQTLRSSVGLGPALGKLQIRLNYYLKSKRRSLGESEADGTMEGGGTEWISYLEEVEILRRRVEDRVMD